jgi:electron transfer flavoprotein beta subunit
MKFSVCIKQVPDVAAPISLRDGRLDVDPGRLMLNAYDASAVEEALVLTEKYGGEVEVILVGPERAQETIRKALAMGAGSAVQLKVPDGADLDSRRVAEILAEFFRGRDVDVISLGKQAQDSDAGLTGSMLAALLELPFATNAVGLDIESDKLVVTRQGDTGREIVELMAPCVVTCSNDMNDPRIPNLKGIMAAKRKSLEIVEVDPDAAGDRSIIVDGFENVPDREPGVMLEGEIDEQIADLVSRLRTEARAI